MDPPAATLNHLQKTFGVRLFAAAERLVDGGCVSEVRVLQAGAVVTGIAAAEAPAAPGADQSASRRAAHRVYVQQRSAAPNGQPGRGPAVESSSIDSLVIDGECSCGERGHCVHVAAVLIAAARTASPASSAVRRPNSEQPLRRSPDSFSAGVTGQRQQLFYLIEPVAGGGAALPTRAKDGSGGVADSEGIRFSIWVGQTSASGSGVERDGACLFVPRTLISGDWSGRDVGQVFPRYVAVQDKEILKSLPLQNIDGPWDLRGLSGAELLRRLAGTGRAFWKSLQSRPLRAGAARQAAFAWESLPNGDQQLRCEVMPSNASSPAVGAPTKIVLDVEPAIYIDAASGEWGALELPCAQSLLRQHWNQPAIAPEQVDGINEHLARDTGSRSFPRLRTTPVQRQPLRSLSARLVLTGVATADTLARAPAAPAEAASSAPTRPAASVSAPEALLHFLYNELSVDSRRLRPEHAVVRQMADNTLHEITRDLAAEQKLRAQLQQAFGSVATGATTASSFSRENWLAFMLNALPTLRLAGWQVDIHADFPYRIAAPDKWYGDLQKPGDERRPGSSSRHADRQQDWFDLRIGVVVDGHAVNLLPALASYLQAASDHTFSNRLIDDAPYCLVGEHLLIRMDDGRYVPVALERIQRIADTLVELFDRDSLNPHAALSLPRGHASRLAQLALGLGSPALRSDDPSMLTLVGSLDAFARATPLPAPAHFRATLRPYQEEGLGWLQLLRTHGLGGILADDMGLGKTVQTLAHLALEREQGRLSKPALIVAPVSVIGNWGQEIRRFAPHLNLVILHGARRREAYAAVSRADIVVTGYPLLILDNEMLMAREFSFVILDEAQNIKNPRSQVSRAARLLRAEHRLCLTGTPMENHLGELWALFDFLQPGFLGDEKQFQRQYRMPIEKNADRNRFHALTKRIAPFVLRRTKDAVAKELPPKTQIVETIVLEERQRDLYDGIRLGMHRHVREIIEAQGLARSHITVLDALLKLRQACCDPRLVAKDPDTQSIPSAKLDWLLTVLPELVAEGRHILLFSQFTSMLRLIESAVRKLAIPYCLLTGETQHREDVVERFQSGQVPLFLVSLKAGGTGLNLTAADTVIHYDPWWNPAVEAQATDRAHRIGQDKPVFVYKLIAQGTVEEKIMQLQAQKHALASQLYADPNALPAQLTTADLESLFAS